VKNVWFNEKAKEVHDVLKNEKKLLNHVQFFSHSLVVFNDESKHQKTKSNVRERERKREKERERENLNDNQRPLARVLLCHSFATVVFTFREKYLGRMQMRCIKSTVSQPRILKLHETFEWVGCNSNETLDLMLCDLFPQYSATRSLVHLKHKICLIFIGIAKKLWIVNQDSFDFSFSMRNEYSKINTLAY